MEQRLRPLLRAFQLAPWTSRFKGFFALFPGGKKVRRSPAPRGRNWVRTSAHGHHELSWLGRRWLLPWLVRLFWSTLLRSGIWSSRQCRLSTSAVVTRQSTEASGSSWPFHSCSVRCSHLEICALFPPVLVLCMSGVWVLLLDYRELDSLGDAVGRNAWLDSGHMLRLSVA